MRQIVFLFLLLTFSIGVFAQYEFIVKTEAPCTEIKDQQKTGTCWSFATCSFIESELMRDGKGSHDLSEMYVVKHIYREKAMNYILRQGKANFSQGSLAHDVISAIRQYGIVSQDMFDVRTDESEPYDHGEFVAATKGMLDGLLKRKTLSQDWKEALDAMLDIYFGEAPTYFKHNDVTMNPQTYAEHLGIEPDDYISLTSFSHHPFYQSFILEIPDNFSNGSYYNIHLNELEQVIDEALEAGYTIAWDGDVSEKGFSSAQGIAVLPQDASREDLFTMPGPEIEVKQQNRQLAFESLATTDDHLMHIIGIATDQNGNKYYKIKNSWGKVGPMQGYLYMSAPYFRMKTISVTMHRDAVAPEIREKMEM